MFWQQKPENVPIAEEPVVDREASTRERLHELKQQLAALDAKMLAFKTTYKVRSDRFGRLLGIECQGITGFPEVEREWRILLKKRDSLITQWHSALHEWSAAKQLTKEVLA